MRIPMSRVRRATVYAMIPYSPMLASSIASKPNTPASFAINWSVWSESPTSTCIVLILIGGKEEFVSCTTFRSAALTLAGFATVRIS